MSALMPNRNRTSSRKRAKPSGPASTSISCLCTTDVIISRLVIFIYVFLDKNDSCNQELGAKARYDLDISAFC